MPIAFFCLLPRIAQAQRHILLELEIAIFIVIVCTAHVVIESGVEEERRAQVLVNFKGEGIFPLTLGAGVVGIEPHVGAQIHVLHNLKVF